VLNSSQSNAVNQHIVNLLNLTGWGFSASAGALRAPLEGFCRLSGSFPLFSPKSIRSEQVPDMEGDVAQQCLAGNDLARQPPVMLGARRQLFQGLRYWHMANRRWLASLLAHYKLTTRCMHAGVLPVSPIHVVGEHD
jgi:hypothetical protein